MLTTILKRILLILSLPLRYIIRFEVRHVLQNEIRDIIQPIIQNEIKHVLNNEIGGTIRPIIQDVVRPIVQNGVWKLSTKVSTQQSIEMALQRRATDSTTNYVEKHLKMVDSVSSNLDLLTMALKKAHLGDHDLICEFGVFTGRSINHISTLIDQTVYGFDSFEGLPERWRDGFEKGYFKMDALPDVNSNVVLIKGLFEDTLPVFVKEHDASVAFIHVDCDLYSSTKTIFKFFENRIHPGCIIVFNEYFNYYGWEEGEFKAFHEFIERTGLDYEYIGYNRLHEQVAVIIKTKPNSQSLQIE